MDQLSAIRIFIKVSELGSFTAAAISLNLSTATISRSISYLEDSIQARLMQRNTRRQSLTEAGARYLISCKEIIAKVDQAANEATESCLKPSGCLRVSADTAFAIECLLPLVADYSNAYKDVTLDLTLTMASSTSNMIDEQQDAQIVLSRDLLDSEMVAQYIGSAPNILCASPDYLSAEGIPTTPHDLNNHICLRLPDAKSSDNWIFDNSTIIQPGETLKINLAQAMIIAAKAGMGICLLPSFVAVNALKDGTLVRVLPDFELHSRNIYAVYSSRRFLDAKIKTWVDFLRSKLPKSLDNDLITINNQKYWARRLNWS